MDAELPTVEKRDDRLIIQLPRRVNAGFTFLLAFPLAAVFVAAPTLVGIGVFFPSLWHGGPPEFHGPFLAKPIGYVMAFLLVSLFYLAGGWLVYANILGRFGHGEIDLWRDRIRTYERLGMLKLWHTRRIDTLTRINVEPADYQSKSNRENEWDLNAFFSDAMPLRLAHNYNREQLLAAAKELLNALPKFGAPAEVVIAGPPRFVRRSGRAAISATPETTAAAIAASGNLPAIPEVLKFSTFRTVKSKWMTRLITFGGLSMILGPIVYVAVGIINQYVDYASQRTTIAIIGGHASGGFGGLSVFYTFIAPSATHPKGVQFQHWESGVSQETFNLKRGTPVTICYLARDPNKCVLGGHYPLDLNPWTFDQMFQGITGVGLLWFVAGRMFIKRHKRMSRAQRLLQCGQPTYGVIVRLARKPARKPSQLNLNGIPIYTSEVDKSEDIKLVRYDYCVDGRVFTDYAPDWELQYVSDGKAIVVVYDPADPKFSYPLKLIMRYYVV